MEDSSKSTNYDKVSVAVAKMQNNNIKIGLPDINEAERGFVPKAKENKIIYSLKAINGIGDEVVELIINNRPYISMEDFYERMIDTKLVKNSQMIQLIKAGAFERLSGISRKDLMKDYINKKIFQPNEKVTFQNFSKMQELGMFPEELKNIVRIKNFKDYILHEEFFVKNIVDENKKLPKCGYHDRYFRTDEKSTPFLIENFSEDCIVKTSGCNFIISEKKFVKEWKKLIEPLKDWMSKNETVELYNKKCFDEIWNKYASGSQSDWYMSSIGAYYEEHSLQYIDLKLYTIDHFSDLSEEPQPYEWYSRRINGEIKQLPKYKISRICGTVINNDAQHYTITLLTDNRDIVNIKLDKGQYAYYNKRISQRIDENSDKKKVLETSWLSRGSKLFIHGIRRRDKFCCKTYKDSIFKHSIYRIDNVYEDGKVDVTTDRIKI